MSFDVVAVRRQFPILAEIIDGRPVHYLDNGASAQTPLAVLEAVRAYETTGRANVLRGVHRLAERATEAYENARIEVATFLGVAPLEVNPITVDEVLDCHDLLASLARPPSELFPALAA